MNDLSKRLNKPGSDYWKTRDEGFVVIKEMDNEHLLRTIDYLERKAREEFARTRHYDKYGLLPATFCKLSWKDFLPKKYYDFLKEARRRGIK